MNIKLNKNLVIDFHSEKEKEMGEPISKSYSFADYFEALSFVTIADFFLAALFL